MTFAAYNAGRGSVKKWVERYGDPRDPKVDAVDWVELIPFSETRNYVQRIMENLQVYRARFGGGTRLQIEADLRRGAGSVEQRLLPNAIETRSRALCAATVARPRTDQRHARGPERRSLGELSCLERRLDQGAASIGELSRCLASKTKASSPPARKTRISRALFLRRPCRPASRQRRRDRSADGRVQRPRSLMRHRLALDRNKTDRRRATRQSGVTPRESGLLGREHCGKKSPAVSRRGSLSGR